MKILITGTKGLAKALGDVYDNRLVTLVSHSNGTDINNVDQWGPNFLHYDCVFNCAYDGFALVGVLEFFYQNHACQGSNRYLRTKTIQRICSLHGRL